MNLLERIPTRWLLTGAVLGCLVLWAAPGWAQSGDDPAHGKLLFEDAPGEAPAANLTHTCTNCHVNVQDRRTHIAGSAYADISLATAMTRFGTAVSLNQGGQMGQFTRLDTQQTRDIAAYIADTPKLSADTLTFTASAINTNTLSQSVDLANAVTSGTLTITNVAIGGSGAARFTATADTCSTQTLPASTTSAASTCRVSVRFSAPNTSAYTGTLTLTMRVQGTTTTFTRVVALSGQVATAPVGGSGDSGGGALGLAWLAGLALATGALARRRA